MQRMLVELLNSCRALTVHLAGPALLGKDCSHAGEKHRIVVDDSDARNQPPRTLPPTLPDGKSIVNDGSP